MRVLVLAGVAVALLGCPSSSTTSSSGSSGASGTTSSGGSNGGGGFDAGLVGNSCVRDQDCGSGRICAGDGGCANGLPCTAGSFVCGECEPGGSASCGFSAVAYCDAPAAVCRRVLSSCEPCTSDDTCGENIQLGVPNKCIDYGNGQRFCGLACTGNNCSAGFECQAAAGGACAGAGCACKVAPAVGACQGAVPCTTDAECPTGNHCTTAASNPPRRGVCLAFCLADNECPRGKVCQTQPGPSFGQCIMGCVAGQAGPNGTICHEWGRNGPRCPATACMSGYECSAAVDGYCQLPGCQTDSECVLARTICNMATGECEPGCRTEADCGAFELCTNGQCVEQGCRGKDLSCNLGQFCCGKELYDPAGMDSQACPSDVMTGDCFTMRDPFCRTCMDDNGCMDINSFGLGSHCYELQRGDADGGSQTIGKFCSVGCRTGNDCPRGMPCQDVPAGQNGEMVKACLSPLCASINPMP